MNKALTLTISLLAVSVIMAFSFEPDHTDMLPAHRALAKLAPVAPAQKYSAFRTGPLEVAKVFGRSQQGCQNADIDLITEVSNAAVNVGLDPKLVAAEVAIESSCNPMAVSNRGAVGLLQVHVKTWQVKYDFSRINLFDAHQNLKVGTQVLAGYVERYGLRDGVRHYNGMGVDCSTCDAGYTQKVLSLTGSK